LPATPPPCAKDGKSLVEQSIEMRDMYPHRYACCTSLKRLKTGQPSVILTRGITIENVYFKIAVPA